MASHRFFDSVVVPTDEPISNLENVRFTLTECPSAPQTRFVSNGKVFVVTICRLTQITSFAGLPLQQIFEELIESRLPPYRILIDLSQMDTLPEPAVGILGAIGMAFSETGNEMLLCGLSKTAAQTISSSRFGHVLRFASSYSEAISALS